jgi:hypothetical protein
MEDLFRSYWWLLFPLGFFIASAFDQLMRYQRHRDTLDLIKSYTDQGKEPPAALVERVAGKLKVDEEAEDNEDGWDDRAERRRYRRLRRRERSWYQVVLFGVMAAGFGIASLTHVYPSASGAFLIVTFVMAALCLASLVTILTSRRD